MTSSSSLLSQLSVHSYVSLVAFAVTIVLVVTSPRIPIMFRFCHWWRRRKNNGAKNITGEDANQTTAQNLEAKLSLTAASEAEHNNNFVNDGGEKQTAAVDDNKSSHERFDESYESSQSFSTATTTTTTTNVVIVAHDHNDDESFQQQKQQQTRSKLGQWIDWYHHNFIFMSLDVGTAPVLILLLLLCTQTLSPSILWRGIIGNDYLQPYSIVLLFMSLAYVCISLDMTQLFQFLAQNIVNRSKDSGKRLFVAFSVFTSLLTIFTSNDIVILTVTPILCYTARQTKNLNPIPFVTTQFFLANVWSITLKIGNPTNIIVAEAYHFSFLSYFLWMAVPAIVAGTSTFFLSYLVFRNQIPDRIELLSDGDGDGDGDDGADDGADNGEGVEGDSIDNDDYHDGMEQGEIEEQNGTSIGAVVAVAVAVGDTEVDDGQQLESGTKVAKKRRKKRNSGVAVSIELDKKMAILKSVLLLVCLTSLATLTNIKAVRTWMICVGFGILFLLIDLVNDLVTVIRVRSLKLWWFQHKSTSVTWMVLQRMPWKIVPFVFSMFIIVELLAKYGLISLLAQAMCQLFNRTMTKGHDLTFGQKLSSVSIMVFSISILSFLACNMMNNQPMTILFTTLLHDPSLVQLFAESHPSVQQGAMLSLVVGSNLGANFTLIGALAGLLWIGILRDLNSTNGMTSFTFTKYALCVSPLVVLLVGVALVTQLMVFG